MIALINKLHIIHDTVSVSGNSSHMSVPFHWRLLKHRPILDQNEESSDIPDVVSLSKKDPPICLYMSYGFHV